jgi:hypothetical protein
VNHTLLLGDISIAPALEIQAMSRSKSILAFCLLGVFTSVAHASGDCPAKDVQDIKGVKYCCQKPVTKKIPGVTCAKQGTDPYSGKPLLQCGQKTETSYECLEILTSNGAQKKN